MHAFQLGRCGDAELEQIGGHLEQCPTCEARLTRLDGAADGLLRGLRDAQPTAVEWVPGTIVDEYEILEPLGAGGMGRVWKARHRRMNRVVAIKSMNQRAGADAALIDRFHREVQALAELRHPNIALAFDAGDDYGRPFLVMEYLEGVDLARRLQQIGPLSVADACDAITQAARGLQYAHDRELIHRDVKPANLFLTSDGTIKVLDLGLVRRAADAEWVGESRLPDHAHLTSATTIMGTLDFAAPEQTRAGGVVDHRADIYGLGCTLHALLTGASPFARATPAETLHAHHHEVAPPLRLRRQDVPLRLEQLCQRMLARDPENRCGSMAEVLAELEQLRRPTRRRVAAIVAATLLVSALVAVVLIARRPAVNPLAAPAEVAAVQASQEAWAEKLATPVRVTNSLGMALVLIPPGRFADESAGLAMPAFFGAHETTVAAFRKFVAATGYKTEPQRNKGGWIPRYERLPHESYFDERQQLTWETPGYPITEAHPVSQVSWNDAMAFCRWLGEQESATYRLPTLAEARWAMLAGAATPYYFGDEPARLIDHAWLDRNSNRRARAIGLNKPNAWGLYDTLGNLTEWVADWGQRDPQVYKSVFGGSYYDNEATLLTQTPRHIDRGMSFVGFRVVRECDRR